MKIALIGPGLMPIPPTSWGAVEILMWNYKIYLQGKGHEVQIYNTKDLSSVKRDIESKDFDIVHLHFDNYLNFFEGMKCKNFFVTSHYGNLPNENNYEPFYWNIFYTFLKTNHKIIALSPEIKNKYESYGLSKDKCLVVHNGVESDKFVFNPDCELPDRTIYFGRLEKRKGQHLFSDKTGFNLDFVGNVGDLHNLSFSKDNRYLGTWSKDKVYTDLTKYANMALISYGEAHPLVCIESLSAGLGVVVSEIASANLDTTKEFITVIPDNKIEDFDYVRQEIIKNREISITMREEIRQYAVENFSWDKVVDKYLKTVKEAIE